MGKIRSNSIQKNTMCQGIYVRFVNKRMKYSITIIKYRENLSLSSFSVEKVKNKFKVE